MSQTGKEKGKGKERRDTIISLNGHDLDLKKAWPMKWKDIKKLRKLDVTDEGLEKGDVEQTEQFLLYVLQKIDPKVTNEDIDELEIGDIQKIVAFFQTNIEELNLPT